MGKAGVVGAGGEEDDGARVRAQDGAGEREAEAHDVSAPNASDAADLEGVNGGPDDRAATAPQEEHAGLPARRGVFEHRVQGEESGPRRSPRSTVEK